MTPFTAHATGVDIAVRVSPRASAEGVAGQHGAALKIRLRAPPVDGKANAALLRYLAKALAIAPSRVELLTGESGRLKRVRVHGVSLNAVRAALGTF